MHLIYHEISSPTILTGTQRIVFAWNSQMTSSLSQICVLRSTSSDNVKLSTRDGEENTGLENPQVFTVAANRKLKKSLVDSRL